MDDWKKVEQNINEQEQPSVQQADGADMPAEAKAAAGEGLSRKPSPARKAGKAAAAQPAQETPLGQQGEPEEVAGLRPAGDPESADELEAAADLASAGEPEVAVIHTSSRYTKRGRRKGRYRFAAPLGMVVILLALFGLFSLILFTISGIRSARDTTKLREDLYYILKPLAQYTPEAFTDVNESKQDALIQAALYKIVNAELIRQRQVGTDQSLYPYDDYGRMIIPLDKVNTAYAELFGNAAKPYHHTFGEDAGVYFTYEYNPDYEGKAVYHTPVNMGEGSLYEPVIGTIKKSGDTLKVQVGYVYINDIKPDDRGNDIITIDMAQYYQIYTLERTQDGSYIIISVEDVKE